jgi:hypothetical protein
MEALKKEYIFNGNDYSENHQLEKWNYLAEFYICMKQNTYNQRWWLEKIRPQILCAATAAQYWTGST